MACATCPSVHEAERVVREAGEQVGHGTVGEAPGHDLPEHVAVVGRHLEVAVDCVARIQTRPAAVVLPASRPPP